MANDEKEIFTKSIRRPLPGSTATTARELSLIKKALSEKDFQLKTKDEKLSSAIEETSQIKSLLASRNTQIETQKKQLAVLEEQILRMKNTAAADGNASKALLIKVQDENTELKKENAALISKLDASYTAQDLAEYFNKTIDSFNAEMSDTAGTYNYIINSMDVDLKAQIIKNNNELRFLSDPKSNSDSALSTVKISIRAVPK